MGGWRIGRFGSVHVSIVFWYRYSIKLGPGSPSPPCWSAGRFANEQGGEVGRHWGAPGLRSEDVSSSDRIERLALPKGESLNAIKIPSRRALRASCYPSTPADSTPIPFAVRVQQARRRVQVLVFGFTEICKGLGFHGAGFAARGFAPRPIQRRLYSARTRP